MKRFISSIVLTLFTATLLVVPTVREYIWAHLATQTASATADSDAAFGVAYTSSGGSSYSPLSGNFFLVDDNIGQDIYKNIYERVRSEGSDLTIERTGARRALSEDELNAILPGSNIGNLLTQPDPLAPLSVPEIESRRAAIISDIADEKALADLEVLTKMQVESTEIFSNGDESDSGFDLISDLDVIEDILFAKDMTGLPGSDNGGRAGSHQVSPNQSPDADNQDDPRNNLNRRRQVPERTHEVVSPLVAPNPDASKVADAVSCPVESDFHTAVEEARDDDAQAAAAQADNGGIGTTEQGLTNGGADTSDDDPGEEKELVAASGGDWSRPVPCSKFFCIKFEMKYKEESSYSVSDNCIACHIQKINEIFNKTLSHNLVPNKVTGNLIEGPKCKDALAGMNMLTMNFVFIPQPILTPPNDDLVVKGDIWRNIKDAIAENFGQPNMCKESKSWVCQIDRAKLLMTQIKPDDDFTVSNTSLDQETRALKAKKMREYRESQLKNMAVASASQYQVIVQELDTMNNYFKNYMTLFESLVNDPEQSPCGRLQNIQYCK